MAAILNYAILNLAILDSTIIVFSFNLTHTCQDWFPPFAQKNFTHSFWLNLMMAAILISLMLDSDTALLDSDTLLSSLRFTQKHSHSTLTLTQTNSIWLKLIHSHLTWWWWPSWIWPSWIQQSLYFLSKSLTLAKIGSHHFHKTFHSFILTQLDDDSHLELCHLEFGDLGFNHHSFFFQSHSHLPRLVPTLCTKKLHSFILTQLDDGSHLDFSHVGFRHCPIGFKHLVIFSQIHSETLSLHSDSDSN